MHRLLTFLIAFVWLANGLLCKLLLLVPRHAAIVARILGPAYASTLTRLIGLGEIGMALAHASLGGVGGGPCCKVSVNGPV